VEVVSIDKLPVGTFKQGLVLRREEDVRSGGPLKAEICAILIIIFDVSPLLPCVNH
jgi:hypothetical protein